jgi:hypothetical protein
MPRSPGFGCQASIPAKRSPGRKVVAIGQAPA